MISKTEEKLIRSSIQGDRRAQSKLYDLFHRRLFGVCLRYAATRVEAEDILLDGFCKIFSALDQFRGQSALYTWMRKIMVNTALMHLRKKKVLNFSMLEISEADSVADPVVIEKLAAEDIYRTLQKLPRGFRIVFNLYVIEGFSHREIARELNISESTSRSQYARARKAFQHLLVRDHIIPATSSTNL